MNHSILTINILHGLHGACDSQELYEEAEVMYFRWLDFKESTLMAEAKTLEWIEISSFLHKIYPFCREQYKNIENGFTEGVQADLHEFIRKRFEVYRRGKDINPLIFI